MKIKKILAKALPNRTEIQAKLKDSNINKLLHHHYLWHLNKHTTSKAIAIGLFCAMLPIPGQMLVAALIAIWLHANLALAITCVWITNPITMPAIFFFAYQIGSKILESKVKNIQFGSDPSTMLSQIANIWQPLLLGSMIMAIVLSLSSYLLVRITWRFMVLSNRQQRKKKNN